MGVTERDLRQLLDVVECGRQADPEELFPRELLAALAELVPAEDATFQLSRPLDRVVVGVEEHSVEEDLVPPGWEDLFWRSYWEGETCCRPQLTGDYKSVWKVSDYLSRRQLADSVVGEWFRVAGIRHEIAVPLPVRGGEDRRILLFRTAGRDFTERERLLLTMLRPHFIEVLRAHERRRAGVPELTTRQLQLLQLVADGHSNTQIAHRLFVAEGTVRKHLENIYERLGVTSRTAAVATAFPRTHSA
ncbi:LuxR C-terminal-related transcriptional regulator [Kribbella sp. NPDC003557]|uniref:helix-turn-helix transcriptional regulator n=1 Tax=Kribbella sp. NPDC003557 TaxID=3154449 RepID=UPI0033B4E1CA